MRFPIKNLLQKRLKHRLISLGHKTTQALACQAVAVAPQHPRAGQPVAGDTRGQVLDLDHLCRYVGRELAEPMYRRSLAKRRKLAATSEGGKGVSPVMAILKST